MSKKKLRRRKDNKIRISLTLLLGILSGGLLKLSKNDK